MCVSVEHVHTSEVWCVVATAHSKNRHRFGGIKLNRRWPYMRHEFSCTFGTIRCLSSVAHLFIVFSTLLQQLISLPLLSPIFFIIIIKWDQIHWKWQNAMFFLSSPLFFCCLIHVVFSLVFYRIMKCVQEIRNYRHMFSSTAQSACAKHIM